MKSVEETLQSTIDYQDLKIEEQRQDLVDMKKLLWEEQGKPHRNKLIILEKDDEIYQLKLDQSLQLKNLNRLKANHKRLIDAHALAKADVLNQLKRAESAAHTTQLRLDTVECRARWWLAVLEKLDTCQSWFKSKA